MRIGLLSRLLCFVLSVSLLSACVNPKPFEFKGVKSVKVEKASLGKSLFNANFEYYNPNNFTVSLKRLDCEIRLNDEPFTNYQLDSVFVIPANANFLFPAKMEIELSSILKHSVAILFNQPIKIEIKGDAIVSKGMFTKHYPIAYSTNQKLNLKEAITGSK